MLYIFCAMPEEAGLIIKERKLKNKRVRYPETYSDEDKNILLFITGVSALPAASAVSAACTLFPPGEDDILLNFGSCCKDRDGESKENVFIGARITDSETGREYFPDLFYTADKAAFSRIITVYRPVISYEEAVQPYKSDSKVPIIFEMEASGIFEAGKHFFSPDRIQFLKVVSDDGTLITIEELKETLNKEKDIINSFIDTLLDGSKSSDKEKIKKKREKIEKIVKDLSCDVFASETMKHKIESAVTYLELSETSYLDKIEELYKKGILPAKTRKDGKEALKIFLTETGFRSDSIC